MGNSDEQQARSVARSLRPRDARIGRRQSRRGALITILACLLLLFTLMMVSSAATLFQQNLRHLDDAKSGARRMAESAVQAQIARLVQAPDLAPAACPSLDLTLSSSYPGARGLVALEPGESARLQIPLSVNNLTGTGSLPGWGGTVVEPETANIVGVGRYRGREQRIEAVLHVPRFPYVVSSSVPIQADRLHVFGVRDPSALLGGFGAIPPEMKEPGHIATNAPDQSGSSLKLLSTTIIEGDAQSRGSVQVDPGATVTGSLRPQAELAPLPRIDIRSLDTATRPGVSTLSSASLGATTLSGFNRRAGDLAINGGLRLDGGVLFVEGGVTIQGGLSGTGALIASGPVQIEGGGSLSGMSGTAVVAGGPIRLQGSAGQQAEFRGLLYTEGDLDCRYTNVAGSVVVNNPNPSGVVSLHRSTLVQSQGLGVVTVPVATTVPVPAGGLTPMPPTLHANLTTMGDPYGFGVPAANLTLRGTTQTAPTLFTANMNGPREDYSAPPPGFPVTHPPTAAEPWYEIGLPNPMPADPITLGSIRVNNPNPSGEIDRIDANGVGWQDAFVGDFTDRASARAALFQVAADWGSVNAAGSTDAFLDDAAQYMVTQAPEIVRIFNANSRLLGQAATGGGGGGSTTTVRTVVVWQLDLSRFYNLSDRIRLRSWREL